MASGGQSSISWGISVKLPSRWPDRFRDVQIARSRSFRCTAGTTARASRDTARQTCWATIVTANCSALADRRGLVLEAPPSDVLSTSIAGGHLHRHRAHRSGWTCRLKAGPGDIPRTGQDHAWSPTRTTISALTSEQANRSRPVRVQATLCSILSLGPHFMLCFFAQIAACILLSTWIFFRMALRCTLTVASAMSSCLAICLF